MIGDVSDETVSNPNDPLNKNVDVPNQNLARLSRLPRFYRLIRVIRLFRLLKFNHTLKNLLTNLGINAAVGKLFTVILFVIFIVHMVACIWYWLADLTEF